HRVHHGGDFRAYNSSYGRRTTMSTTTLAQQYQSYGTAASYYWAQNAVWNPKSASWTETVTLNTDTTPAGTVLAWNWPSSGDGSQVYAYPEVIYGRKPWDGQPYGLSPPSTQVDSFQSLTANFSLTNSGSASSIA